MVIQMLTSLSTFLLCGNFLKRHKVKNMRAQVFNFFRIRLHILERCLDKLSDFFIWDYTTARILFVLLSNFQLDFDTYQTHQLHYYLKRSDPPLEDTQLQMRFLKCGKKKHFLKYWNQTAELQFIQILILCKIKCAQCFI